MSDRNIGHILFAISLFAVFAAFAFYAAFYFTTSFLIHDSVNKTLLWSGLFDRQIRVQAEKNASPEPVIATSTKPSITFLSPSGGEAWKIGSTETIKWNSSKDLTVDGGDSIVITNSPDIRDYWLIGTVTTNGYIHWTVGETATLSVYTNPVTLLPGTYYIVIDGVLSVPFTIIK